MTAYSFVQEVSSSTRDLNGRVNKLRKGGYVGRDAYHYYLSKIDNPGGGQEETGLRTVSCMSQDEHDRHRNRKPKSKPRVRRGLEGTFTDQGMTRETERGRGGGDKYVRLKRIRASLRMCT